jgi:hypothetical protein
MTKWSFGDTGIATEDPAKILFRANNKRKSSFELRTYCACCVVPKIVPERSEE